MGDTAVDFFLETLKQLLTCSNLDFTIDQKLQLQSLEEEIKYLREFLKITEKKRNEHSEVMKLVMQIRDVVSEAENIVELFVVLVIKADHAFDFLREHKDYLSFDLVEKVKKEIKTLTAEVKQIYNENMYDMNGVVVKKPKHSSTESGGGIKGIIASFSTIIGSVISKHQGLWSCGGIGASNLKHLLFKLPVSAFIASFSTIIGSVILKQNIKAYVSSWRHVRKSDENGLMCLDWDISCRVFEAS
ncbi:hypothetical protein RHMOL_Rhmol12G0243600 [Rhododendron molle]|uniref:Uncharacterized protein n=1 Tax=Rhododendron molle TaxID=49168 RepID=A0ACC0LMC4_RHOML|nr:hypothetical protein RHMOL_Rhmol12G0243600 [Rhododendron molle]